MDEREIAGKEAAKLFFEQIREVEELIKRVEKKLGKEEVVSLEEWENLRVDLDREILGLSGLESIGKMLTEKQKALLNKLKAQKEQVDRMIEDRKRGLREAA